LGKKTTKNYEKNGPGHENACLPDRKKGEKCEKKGEKVRKL
jgi:hypothetical protein